MLRLTSSLAVNACARLRLDRAYLASLRDLLVPGGLFLALEPEPNALWDLGFRPERELVADPLAGATVHRRCAPRGLANRADRSGPSSPQASVRTATAPWPNAGVLGRCAAPFGASPRRSSLACRAHPRRRRRCFRRYLQDRVAGSGRHVRRVQSSDFLAQTEADRAACSGTGMDEIVLFLAEEPGDDDTTLHVAQQIAALARVAAICAKRDIALWIVTCEAQQATVTNHGAGLVGGALWGLGRALVNELPQLSVRLLDFSHAAAPGERAKQVAAEVTAALGRDGSRLDPAWPPCSPPAPGSAAIVGRRRRMC